MVSCKLGICEKIIVGKFERDGRDLRVGSIELWKTSGILQEFVG